MKKQKRIYRRIRLGVIYAFVSLLISLMVVVYPVVQDESIIQVENDVELSPIQISLFLDLVDISPMLRGVTESNELFWADMEKTNEMMGFEWKYADAKYERALAVSLRNVRVRHSVETVAPDSLLLVVFIRKTVEVSIGR